MDWIVVLVGVVLALWWFGRSWQRSSTPAAKPPPPAAKPPPPPLALPRTAGPVAAAAPLPLAEEVLRRATDMDDPDGTFMDGYVAGRLTERYEARPGPHGGRGGGEAWTDDETGDLSEDGCWGGGSGHAGHGADGDDGDDCDVW